MHKTIISRKGVESEDRLYIFVPSESDYKDKVLAYLSRALGRKITINSIKEDLGLSYGSLHLTIHKLWKDKIISIEEVGNYKLLSLNLKNMLAIAELSRISVKISQEITNQSKKLKKMNELIENLRKYKEILSIVLFGSQARLEAGEKSDIDLLVIVGKWKDLKKKALASRIKADIKSFGTREFLDIQEFIVDYDMYRRMLQSDEALNVGKEALRDGIVLDGFENYWKMAGEIIG